MAEITLEELRGKRQQETLAAQKAPETAVKEMEKQELTPEERERVEQIKEQIDVTDSQMLMQFGSGAKQNIADFSENILNNIRSKDTGYVGDLMTDLIAKVEGLDFESLEQERGLMGLFRKAEAKVKKFMAQYQTLEVQVDAIEAKLDEARMGLLKDIGMFDALYEKNLDYFRQLQLYIVAGEEAIEKLKQETIPSLRREAAASDDPMNAQVVRDFEDTVAQFEKKVFDLKTSRTIALQTAPQIRLIQNNDKLLADKIQTAVQETIPLWKSQMVMALTLHHSQQAMEAQREVNDVTNRLLQSNAEKLHQGSVEIAREAERGIVDIETLQKTNQELISTLEEVRQIQADGAAKRAEAEVELGRIEGELKQKLLELRG